MPYSGFFRYILLLFLFQSITFGIEHEFYPTDIKRIKERGTLIVAQFGGERPGFFAFDDEKKFPHRKEYLYKGKRVIGYDIEIAHKIAKELGVQLEIDREYNSFNDVAKAVAQEKADIAISKLSVTTDRSQYLNYTKPYISLRMALLVNRIKESQIGIRETDPLFACKQNKVSIGVLGQSSFEDHVKKVLPDATVVSYKDQESLFQAVMNGEILALLYEEYEIGKFMRKRPDMPIYCHTVYLPNQKDDIAMAVSGKSVTLHSFLTTFMKKENIHSTVSELLENYVPEDDIEESTLIRKSPFTEITFYISALSALILLMIWLSFSRIKQKTSSTDK